MNFADVLNEIKDGRSSKSILLGNGFVLAGGYNEFNYSSIAEEIIKNPDPEKEKLINFIIKKKEQDQINLEYHLKIFNDVITAIDYMKDSSYCTEINCDTNKTTTIRTSISNDRKKLKELIIDKIRSLHPQNYEKNINFYDCISNIGNFKNLYTLNYDLILYWLFLACNKISKSNFKDAFTEKYNMAAQ